MKPQWIIEYKKNLGVDIRGNDSTYKKPHPSHFNWAWSPPNCILPNFVKFNGEDKISTWEHVSPISSSIAGSYG